MGESRNDEDKDTPGLKLEEGTNDPENIPMPDSDTPASPESHSHIKSSVRTSTSRPRGPPPKSDPIPYSIPPPETRRSSHVRRPPRRDDDPRYEASSYKPRKLTRVSEDTAASPVPSNIEGTTNEDNTNNVTPSVG